MFRRPGRNLEEGSITRIKEKIQVLYEYLKHTNRFLRVYHESDSEKPMARRLDDTVNLLHPRARSLFEDTKAKVEKIMEAIAPRQRRQLIEPTFGTCTGETDYPCPGIRGKFMCVKVEDRHTCPQVNLNEAGVSYMDRLHYYLHNIGQFKLDLYEVAREFDECWSEYEQNPSTLPFRATKAEVVAAGDKIKYCLLMQQPIEFRFSAIDRKGINRISSMLCDVEEEGEYACNCGWYHSIEIEVESKIWSFLSVQLYYIFLDFITTTQLLLDVLLFSHLPFMNDIWKWFWTLPSMPTTTSPQFVGFFGDYGLPNVTYERRFACAGAKSGSFLFVIMFIVTIYLMILVWRPTLRMLNREVMKLKKNTKKYRLFKLKQT